MTCPSCGEPDTRVVRTEKGSEPRRWRRCPKCDHRWKTLERPEDAPLAAQLAPRAPIPVEVMLAALERDRGRCRYCGRQGSLRLKLVSNRGVAPTVDDLISCCAGCDRHALGPIQAATNGGGPAISSRALLPVAVATPRPPPPNSATPSTNSGGGVGGGLSSDPGPDRDPVPIHPVISDPDPVKDRGQEADRARGPAAAPQAPTYRFNLLATNTQAFLRVYHRYPNKVGKSTASQVFHELAGAYEGGEAALSVAILDAFARGMLKRRPYHDDKEGVRFCPALERFLERRLWEDEIPSDAQPQASIYKKLGDE